MRVHYLQHVPFEGLGIIQGWLDQRAARVRCTRLFEQERLPEVTDFDCLIVMGGPMGVNDEARYPWLAAEKDLIAEAIRGGKTVLGVCLGAQLIAAALGATVHRNTQPEIGWYRIVVAGDAQGAHSEVQRAVAAALGPSLEVFHWHGDTFTLPDGAALLASSAACTHQAFMVGDRVLGLQFHLETTPDSARALVEHCRDELVPSPYVMRESELFADPTRFVHINRAMAAVLDALMGAV